MRKLLQVLATPLYCACWNVLILVHSKSLGPSGNMIVSSEQQSFQTSLFSIDYGMTTHPERFCYTKTLQLGISDHDMVVTIRK